MRAIEELIWRGPLKNDCPISSDHRNRQAPKTCRSFSQSYEASASLLPRKDHDFAIPYIMGPNIDPVYYHPHFGDSEREAQ